MECGHVFCATCIEQLKRKRPLCPLCMQRSSRKRLRGVQSIRAIVDATEDVLERWNGDGVIGMMKLDRRQTVAADCVNDADKGSAAEPACEKIRWQTLMNKDLELFDLAIYFVDRDVYDCAVKEWGAVLRSPSDSLAVGSVRQVTFFMHILPQNGMYYTCEQAPLCNPNMVVLYISNGDDHSDLNPDDVILTVYATNKDPALSIVPCNQPMTAWYLEYCRCMYEVGSTRMSVALKYGIPRHPCTQLSRLLDLHKGSKNKTCLVTTSSSEDNKLTASRFCTRYLITYIGSFPKLLPLNRVALFGHV